MRHRKTRTPARGRRDCATGTNPEHAQSSRTVSLPSVTHAHIFLFSTRALSALSCCFRPVIPPPFRFWPRCATRRRRAREQSSVRASPFQAARSPAVPLPRSLTSVVTFSHCCCFSFNCVVRALYFLFVQDVSMTDCSYALMTMPVARHSADGQPFGGGGRRAPALSSSGSQTQLRAAFRAPAPAHPCLALTRASVFVCALSLVASSPSARS